MITFHLASNSDGLIRGLTDALRDGLRDNPSGHNIVVVPDNAALYIELKIMEVLKLRSTFNVEVASFIRLSKKYAGLSGVLTDEGAGMIMKRVILDGGELKCFKDSKDSGGFAKEMYSLIKDLRQSRIDASLFRKVEEKLPPRLRYKVDDISYLYSLYVKELQERGDSLGRLEKLSLEIGKNAHIAASRIFIFLYDGFSSLELDIVSEFFKHCPSVDIGVLRNDSAPNAAVWASGSVLEDLRFRAEKYDIRHCGRNANAIFSHIADNLFSYAKTKSLKSGGAVRLIEADSPLDEVIFAAREIRALAASEGEYGGTAVLVSNPGRYASHIEAVFGKFEIPYSGGGKLMIKNAAPVAFFRAAAELAEKNYSLSGFLEIAKNPYSGIPRGDAESFENYCNRRGFLYLDFTLRDEGAEKIRKRCLELSDPFLKRGEKTDASGFAEKAEEFLRSNAVDESTQAFAAVGRPDDVYFRIQSLKKLRGLLSEFTRVFGGKPMTLGECADIFLSELLGAEAAPLQKKLDVFVGRLEDGVFDKNSLFILGADAGAFPAEGFLSRVLSEKEVETLKGHGVSINPSVDPVARAASILSAPKKRLYICRSLSSKGAPSSVFSQLTDLFSDLKPERPLDVADTAGDVVRLASCRGNLFNTAAAAARKLDDVNAEVIAAACSLLSADEKRLIISRVALEYGRETAKALSDNLNVSYDPDSEFLRLKVCGEASFSRLFFKNRRIRVTQAENYYRCPYRHFLQYGARLAEYDGEDSRARDIGNAVHEVLNEFLITSKDMDEEKASEFAKGLIDEILSKDEYSALNKKNREGVFKRVKADILRLSSDLHALLKKSDFQPFLTEASIGPEGKAGRVTLRNGLELTGKIDRADICGEYVSVVDYKTGSVSRDVFSDLYYGSNLQPFVYLYALKKSMGLKPAAALYLPLKDNFLNEEDAPFRYRAEGCVTDCPDILSRLEKDISPGKSRLLPVKISDGCGRLAVDSGSSAVSPEDFESLCALGVIMAERAAKDMSLGYIAKKPLKSRDKNACDYCPYRTLCGGGEPRLAGAVKRQRILEAARECPPEVLL